MYLYKYIEKIIIIITALSCILIPIFDFLGAFENIPWLSQRVPMMTILVLGITISFILVYLNRLEDSLKDKTEKILMNIKFDELDESLLNELKSIWKRREEYIHSIFEYIMSESFKKESKNLAVILDNIFIHLIKGNFFDTKILHPMDFTLTAINYKGNFIFHPSKEMISTKPIDKYPYSEIIKFRNGELIWINKSTSEQIKRFTHYQLKYRNLRFTKLYFQEFAKFSAIVVFESHINLLHELPKIDNWENGDN